MRKSAEERESERVRQKAERWQRIMTQLVVDSVTHLQLHQMAYRCAWCTATERVRIAESWPR